jgi:2-polyprenyl-3-methyl-5-hydroxy-6-metoxy-1,4-benzoquinol methylase
MSSWRPRPLRKICACRLKVRPGGHWRVPSRKLDLLGNQEPISDGRQGSLLRHCSIGAQKQFFMKGEIADETRIRTAPSPNCALCGSDGQSLYLGQKDRLFGASGLWDVKKCRNRECGLMWLDPMPLKEDIGKAYANYYTHAGRESGQRAGLLKRILWQMKRGYHTAKYGYRTGESFLARCAGKLLYLFPIRRGEVDAEVRFLHAVPAGRLLDVGCGSGAWMVSMRKLGWQVLGVDFDENAVKVARLEGLDVRCGSLEEQGFSNDSFDAVTLSHVIEHVPDPVRTLAECARILKPAGKLVLLTPNGASLGHRVFRKYWRGLEPPRHLHIFSIESLTSILKLAGFTQVTVHPQIASTVLYESIRLWRGLGGSFRESRRNLPAWVFARLFAVLELCLVKVTPSVADCIAGVAVKG